MTFGLRRDVEDAESLAEIAELAAAMVERSRASLADVSDVRRMVMGQREPGTWSVSTSIILSMYELCLGNEARMSDGMWDVGHRVVRERQRTYVRRVQVLIRRTLGLAGTGAQCGSGRGVEGQESSGWYGPVVVVEGEEEGRWWWSTTEEGEANRLADADFPCFALLLTSCFEVLLNPDSVTVNYYVTFSHPPGPPPPKSRRSCSLS